MNETEAFINMVIAGMMDAAGEYKMTQLKTQLLSPDKKEMRQVRIIIVPERMEREWPTNRPLGSGPTGIVS